MAFDKLTLTECFRYRMPTIFHDMAAINDFIVLMDETGFVGLSLAGSVLWERIVDDRVMEYCIDENHISGKTLEGLEFNFPIDE